MRKQPKNETTLTFLLPISLLTLASAQQPFEADTFAVDQKKPVIHFIGHGTLMLDYDGYVIHMDPAGQYADYSRLPKAALVLVTHHHQDRLDTGAIARIRTERTRIVPTKTSRDILGFGRVMANGDSLAVRNIKISAVPAYNTAKGREKYRPRGRDNGYLLDIGGKRVYIAGDTEDIPEMKRLNNIDIASLPMNQPYTMTPKQLAAAVKAFKPRIVYPYRYGDSDLKSLPGLLEGPAGPELRTRRMN